MFPFQSVKNSTMCYPQHKFIFEFTYTVSGPCCSAVKDNSTFAWVVKNTKNPYRGWFLTCEKHTNPIRVFKARQDYVLV